MRDKPRPRITREQIAEIHRLRRRGLLLREVAAELGITLASVWRHREIKETYSRCEPMVKAESIAAFIAPPTRAQLMGRK